MPSATFANSDPRQFDTATLISHTNGYRDVGDPLPLAVAAEIMRRAANQAEVEGAKGSITPFYISLAAARIASLQADWIGQFVVGTGEAIMMAP